MKARPYIGHVARKTYTTIPYVATALTTVPLIAPEYGETIIQLYGAVGTTSMGC